MLLYDKKRRKIQILILLVWILIILQLMIGVTGIAHAYCPNALVCFGCLNLGQHLGDWMFPGAIIFGIVIMVTTLFLGRQFCGLICPFGIIQDLVFSLNKKAGKRNYKLIIPLKTHKWIKHFKYIVLLTVIITAYLGLNYIYLKFCPVMALGHIQHITIAGIFSLFIIFVIGFFIERFWCLYLCPYGALLNVVQYLGRILRIPRKKILWNKECCIDCMLCNDYCPMRIDVQQANAVNDVECIYCKRCILCCPVLKKQKKENKDK